MTDCQSLTSGALRGNFIALKSKKINAIKLTIAFFCSMIDTVFKNKLFRESEIVMKKSNKTIALIMAGLLGLSLTACGGSAQTETTAAGGETTAAAEADTTGAADGGETGAEAAEGEKAADGQTYTVGICQLVQHDALDAATKGFIDALTEELGDAVTFDEQNAQGDSNTCATIINGFVSADVDLILANATPALQAAQAGTNEIPILGTSVTEYGVALGIDDFNGTVGGNISGTSDLAPLEEQAAMLHELFPDAEKVGLLYCSAEANSQYQVDTVKAALEALGHTCEYYAFSDSNDLSAVATKASTECDALYVPTDNTVAANTEIVNNIFQPAKIPVVAGEENICAGCGVATLSISYYDLGVGTGKMAAKILTGEADISQMPIEYAPQFTKKYNKALCEDLGVQIPEDYVAIGE